MSIIEIALAWLVVLLPAAFYGALSTTYRPILYGKRYEIHSIMARGETFEQYIQAFGKTSDKTVETALDSLFDRTYGRKRYYFPIIAVSLLSSFSVLLMLVRLGLTLIPADL